MIPPLKSRGRLTTAEEVTSGIDLRGKTVVVTGSTAGIGLETVRVLASRGANVLALGRSKEKVVAAVAAFEPATRAAITPFGCDQANLAAVASCAGELRALGTPLDAVICNAGIIGKWRREEVGGVEKQFLVNHLSHFLLVTQLTDRIVAAPQGRIVMVSSRAHRWAPAHGLDFEDISGANDYFFMRDYGQSKLANHLFTRKLAMRLSGTAATANSVHPGLVATNIFHNLPMGARHIVMSAGRAFMKDIAAGAATTCYVATHPELARVSGLFFADCKPSEVRGRMLDDVMADALWARSEALTRAYI